MVNEYGGNYSLSFLLREDNNILYGELSFVNGGVERTQQPGNGSGDKRLTGRHRTWQIPLAYDGSSWILTAWMANFGDLPLIRTEYGAECSPYTPVHHPYSTEGLWIKPWDLLNRMLMIIPRICTIWDLDLTVFGRRYCTLSNFQGTTEGKISWKPLMWEHTKVNPWPRQEDWHNAVMSVTMKRRGYSLIGVCKITRAVGWYQKGLVVERR